MLELHLSKTYSVSVHMRSNYWNDFRSINIYTYIINLHLLIYFYIFICSKLQSQKHLIMFLLFKFLIT